LSLKKSLRRANESEQKPTLLDSLKTAGFEV
jgi:hypothetical protein